MRILPPKLATYDTYVVHVQKRLLVYRQSVYLYGVELKGLL